MESGNGQRSARKFSAGLLFLFKDVLVRYLSRNVIQLKILGLTVHCRFPFARFTRLQK